MGISKAKISLWLYCGRPSGVGKASTEHPQNSKNWCNQTAQGHQGKSSLCPRLRCLRSALLGAYPTFNKSPNWRNAWLTPYHSHQSSIHVASVCGKRNQFNFPILYGQIFLLAKRTANFFTGALCSLRVCVFSSFACNNSCWKPERLQERYGALGQLHPTPRSFVKAFCPHSRGQTDTAQFQTGVVVGCAEGWAAFRGTRLAPSYGHWGWREAGR